MRAAVLGFTICSKLVSSQHHFGLQLEVLFRVLTVTRLFTTLRVLLHLTASDLYILLPQVSIHTMKGNGLKHLQNNTAHSFCSYRTNLLFTAISACLFQTPRRSHQMNYLEHQINVFGESNGTDGMRISKHFLIEFGTKYTIELKMSFMIVITKIA